MRVLPKALPTALGGHGRVGFVTVKGEPEEFHFTAYRRPGSEED